LQGDFCDDEHWACSTGIVCKNYTIDDCLEEYISVSDVQFCSQCQALYESIPFREYVIGVLGICFAAGERGDECNDVDIGCKSLFCGENNKCAQPCETRNDCIAAALDREVCITSIEYCAQANSDSNGF